MESVIIYQSSSVKEKNRDKEYDSNQKEEQRTGKEEEEGKEVVEEEKFRVKMGQLFAILRIQQVENDVHVT